MYTCGHTAPRVHASSQEMVHSLLHIPVLPNVTQVECYPVKRRHTHARTYLCAEGITSLVCSKAKVLELSHKCVLGRGGRWSCNQCMSVGVSPREQESCWATHRWHNMSSSVWRCGDTLHCCACTAWIAEKYVRCSCACTRIRRQIPGWPPRRPGGRRVGEKQAGPGWTAALCATSYQQPCNTPKRATNGGQLVFANGNTDSALVGFVRRVPLVLENIQTYCPGLRAHVWMPYSGNKLHL
jgi:hypothetical protein